MKRIYLFTTCVNGVYYDVYGVKEPCGRIDRSTLESRVSEIPQKILETMKFPRGV